MCRIITLKTKFPILHHSLLTRPWQKIGSDIFQLGTDFYLMIADYYSLWPEVYQLPTTTSDTLIDAMKQTFAWHGIPEEFVSDNGSQYCSGKFCNFLNEWKVKQTTCSPRYPRSNGLAESMVKSVK